VRNFGRRWHPFRKSIDPVAADTSTPKVYPVQAKPYEAFRLVADVRQYPSKHPDTPWNVQPISVFYDPRRGEVRVTTSRARYDALVFRVEDLPEWEWYRVTERDQSALPLEIRRDAAGVRARWLPLNNEG